MAPEAARIDAHQENSREQAHALEPTKTENGRMSLDASRDFKQKSQARNEGVGYGRRENVGKVGSFFSSRRLCVDLGGHKAGGGDVRGAGAELGDAGG